MNEARRALESDAAEVEAKMQQIVRLMLVIVSYFAEHQYNAIPNSAVLKERF